MKLESNDESIIIQVDYSENFKIDIRDAVQGYFYTSSVVSLFTCYVWHSNGGFSLVFISNNLSHDKYCIGATLDNLFNKLKVKCQYLKEVHMFFDGATQQFNQKFLFRNLCRLLKNSKYVLNHHFVNVMLYYSSMILDRSILEFFCYFSWTRSCRWNWRFTKTSCLSCYSKWTKM